MSVVQSAIVFKCGGGILAYGEENFELPVLLLEHVESLKVAKEALFTRFIARVMEFFVGPLIGDGDLPRFGLDVGERINNMPSAVS